MVGIVLELNSLNPQELVGKLALLGVLHGSKRLVGVFNRLRDITNRLYFNCALSMNKCRRCEQE